MSIIKAMGTSRVETNRVHSDKETNGIDCTVQKETYTGTIDLQQRYHWNPTKQQYSFSTKVLDLVECQGKKVNLDSYSPSYKNMNPRSITDLNKAKSLNF